MAVQDKTLNFTLTTSTNTTVILVFAPPDSDQLFKKNLPVVWKVITFRAKKHNKANVQYALRLAFAYGQTDDSRSFIPIAWAEVQNGDVIGLSGTTDELNFDEKTKGDGSSHIVCKNNTDKPIDLSIGFAKGSDEYEHILFWPRVGGGSNATTQFKPKLTAYVTRDYEVNEVLRGQVQTSAIWSIDLDEIDDVTGWNFVQDGATGAFSIVPATSI